MEKESNVTFGNFGSVHRVEMKCLVGHDGRFERRLDLLGREVVPADGGEEGVLLQRLHALRT